MMKSRVGKIFRHAEKDLDCIAIMNGTEPLLDMTFFYVTGFTSGLFEGSCVFLYPDRSMRLVTSLLERESARRADFPVRIFKSLQDRERMLKAALRGCKKIGVNSAELTYRNLLQLKKLAPKAEFVDISQAVMKARVVKDRKEIATIRRACRITSEVAKEIIPHVAEGVKEYELAARINYLMQRKGASEPAFETIPATGPNSAEAHYTAAERTLKRGDLVLLDFGARYKKYVSDLTRTYVLGKAKRKQKDMHEIVLRAQRTALRRIRPGMKASTVHKAAARIIDKTRYEGKFTHGLGHSIGLSVHDGMGLGPISDFKLEKGMVFTVEPGIYVRGYGGVRIEDDVAVTKDGCEVLTTASRDLIEI
ncbi:MAG: M24 family metallopeptidase [Thermoplasmata archaeon]